MTEAQLIGGNVRRYRRMLGLTQDELITQASISKQTIVELEQGKRPGVRPSTLRKVAHALGVEVKDLFEDEPYPKVHETPLFGSPEWAMSVPVDDFEDDIRQFDLDALNRLGRELAAEHREATGERATGLYQRRRLVWERIKELDPPLCEITYRVDAPPEIVFFRQPTKQEEADLREKIGEYETVRELLAVG